MINILEYQYADNKGAAVNGQTFASPLAYQGTEVNYSSSKVAHEGVDVLNEDGTYAPKWKPVRGKGYVMKDGQAPTEITLNTDGNFTGVEVGDEVTYYYDNETVPVDAPSIKLDIRSLPVETKSRKLKAIWSFDAKLIA